MKLHREFDKKRFANANKRDCGGKKQFPSYRAAAEFNNRIRQRGSALVHKGKKLEKLHVYKCTVCHQFHIGHPPKKNQRYLAL